MTENIVNVTMFGGKSIFGGRETRKEAVISSCPFADKCAALKEGRCAADNPRMDTCINLSNRTVQGYTSRAMKYGEFVSKWKGHEKYNAVKEGLKRFEYIGDNQVRITLPHIDVERSLLGINGYSSMSAGEPFYANKESIDVEAIKRIMAGFSYALMGGKNENKEEKKDMLLALKEVDRELFDAYTESTNVEIDYKGKQAYLVTLKPNINIGSWFWDGEYMSREDFGRVECEPIRGFTKGSQITFKPAEDSLVVVKDNDWVEDFTKFKV